MTIRLPYQDFRRSAKCLTDSHLKEQRIFIREAIHALTVPGRLDRQPVNVLVWEGHMNTLLWICEATLEERRRRGIDERGVTPWMLMKRGERMPTFIGAKEFHDAEKRKLLQLAPAHYGKLGWSV